MDIINAIAGAFIGIIIAILLLIVYNKLNRKG
jgi:hypothetical protein